MDNNNLNLNNFMNRTFFNFYDPFKNFRIPDIEFCLIFINGEKINVVAKSSDYFKSVLKKYLSEERMSKIIKATLNGELIDFNKTISENKIENGNLVYLTVPKDFNLNDINDINDKKFIYIHFFLLFANGHRINIVENINNSFISVLKKHITEKNISKITKATLNGKSIDFNKTISENKIEENNVINIITSKDFDINYFNNENAINMTSSSFNNYYKRVNDKNMPQIWFILSLTNGCNFNVVVNKTDHFKLVLKYFFKEETINKIKTAKLKDRIIDFNKTISENKIENGDFVYLIVSKDFILNNEINNNFYMYNNVYHYINNFDNSKSTFKNLSEFKFIIGFTTGELKEIDGKPNDILKLKLEEYLEKNNQKYKLKHQIKALFDGKQIDINKTLSENKITQESKVIFYFNEKLCNIDNCEIHLHAKIHEHGLVLLYSNRSWLCDICKLKFTDREQTYYCSICDFDVCNHCIGNIKKYPLNYIFNENIFFKYFKCQSHEHKLIYCRTSRYNDKITNWTCQLCNKEYENKIWSFFCTHCNYDVCLSCAGKQYKNIEYTVINFIHGESHVLIDSNLKKNWGCNLCKQNFTVSTNSYSCVKCKNFNLCIDCVYDLAISINKKTKHGFKLFLIKGGA